MPSKRALREGSQPLRDQQCAPRHKAQTRAGPAFPLQDRLCRWHSCAGTKWAWLTSGDLWVRGLEPGRVIVGGQSAQPSPHTRQPDPDAYTCGCVPSFSHVCTGNKHLRVGIAAIKSESRINESCTREAFSKGRGEMTAERDGDGPRKWARGSGPALGQVKSRPIHTRLVEGHHCRVWVLRSRGCGFQPWAFLLGVWVLQPLGAPNPRGEACGRGEPASSCAPASTGSRFPPLSFPGWSGRESAGSRAGPGLRLAKSTPL